jgi:hypothetical protein
VILLMLFSFPSFPEFHRVVPLLQTWSTFEFVYNHTCFCGCVYLWIHLPHMRENMQLLCFWSRLTSLNMMSSNCIHLPSNHMSLFLHCLYISQFLDPLTSCRASGLFSELGYCE